MDARARCQAQAQFDLLGMVSDPRLAAAVVARITYRAHIIQTGTTSYRLNNR